MPRQIDTDKLFETTVAVFAERGYQAATTQEIARRSGVNEVTLFRRFGGKAALIDAALTHTLARSPFARLTVTDDLTTDLVALVEAFTETVRRHGDATLVLLTEIPRHPELREATSALMPNQQAAARVIQAHQDRGELIEGEPMRMLNSLIAPLMVAALWQRTGNTPLGPEDTPEAIVGTFLNGHRADDGR